MDEANVQSWKKQKPPAIINETSKMNVNEISYKTSILNVTLRQKQYYGSKYETDLINRVNFSKSSNIDNHDGLCEYSI